MPANMWPIARQIKRLSCNPNSPSDNGRRRLQSTTSVQPWLRVSVWQQVRR
jgi:hypothetical protein